MTIGSPALAAYSLQVTQLNAQWFGKALRRHKYPNSNAIATAFSAFQHVPIRISPNPSLLPSLIVLPLNDVYWARLLGGAKKTRRLSIPLVMNFVWAAFAVLLTVIDSFHTISSNDVGYAIVTTWTYLLPLIMGWLYVGSQPEPNHLKECLEAANQVAWVATDRKDRPIPVEGTGASRAIEYMEDVDKTRKDELRTAPVFNYSRAFSWSLKAEHVLSLVKNAAANAQRSNPVDNHGDGGGQVQWVPSIPGTVAAENRLGTAEQIIRYCSEDTSTPFERVLGAPPPHIPPGPGPSRIPNTHFAILPFHGPRETRNSRWASGIWNRVVLATLLALGLQWGTVGAAVTIHYWKPPIGLGCRALSFLLYGVAATVAFFLCLTSTVLAQISRPPRGPSYYIPWTQKYLHRGAILCRYLGRGLAIVSGLGIVVVCFFQSGGVFNNCYCASVTFDKGFYDVVFLSINFEVGPGLVGVWIGGLILALSTAVLFGFTLFVAAPPN